MFLKRNEMASRSAALLIKMFSTQNEKLFKKSQGS